MVDFGKLTDKAKDLADTNRDKLEDLAQKGVDEYEKRSGKQAPSQVDALVDKIDPDDNDGAKVADTEEVLARPGATGGAGTKPSDVSGQDPMRDMTRNG